MSIVQLPISTIKVIGSSQIISSVSSVVKELVENSIDSGASNIEIKLLKHGLEKIEVKDDGYGIEKSDAKFVCLPSYTSKIADFSDLDRLSTYGFRGEALSALCNVAEVCITTKTADDEVATCYTYDHSGQITGSKVSHITRGTTISVTDLFKNLPVRKQFISNSKKAAEEINKVEQIVKCLAMIHPHLRVILIHNKFLIWQKNGVTNLRQSAMQVIAPHIVKQLHHILHNIEQTLYNKLLEFFGVYIPVNKYPVSVLSLTLPADCLDVNLEPNKTKIYFKYQDDVLDIVKQCMQLYYGDLEKTADETNLSATKTTKKRKVECDVSEADCKELLVQHNCKAKNRETINEFSLSDSNAVAVVKDNFITKKQVSSDTKPDWNGSLTNHCKKNNLFGESCSGQSQIMNITPENNPTVKICNEFNNMVRDSNFENVGHSVTSVIFQRSHCDHEKNLTNFEIDDKSFEKYKEQTAVSQRCIEEKVMNGCHVLNNTHNKSSLNIKNTKDFAEYLLSPAEKKYGSVLPHSQITSHSDDCDDEIVTLSESSETPASCSRSVEECGPTLSQWSRGDVITPASSVEGSSLLTNSSAEVTPVSCQTLSNRSVSSQMGCKELSTFTTFARNIRKEILKEHPDLGFTKVAQQLQACWQQQSSKEESKRDTTRMENMARITNIFSKKSPSTEIEINMKCLKDMARYSMKKNEHTVELIGQLEASSLWLYFTKSSSIAVFSIHRLKEAVKFYQNLSDYSLPIRLLENCITFSSKEVGLEEWNILLGLERSPNGMVRDPRLLSSGFLVEITEGEEEANLTYVPKNCSYCGVDELQEILSLLKTYGSQASLVECRPLKVISFIRSEVMRECSQEELPTNPLEITNLFSYWLDHVAPKNQTCIHYLPVTYYLDIS